MTDLAKYMNEALKDLALTKSEDALRGWHDLYFGCIEYLQIGRDDAMKLEQAYQKQSASFETATVN
jgi:hypothetical protein